MKQGITFLILTLFCSAHRLAAQQPKTEMADLMRSNGRIYVVVAVMLLILAGLIFYLVRLDKKITKLERDQH